MSNDLLKFVSVILLVLALIAMSFAKYFLPTLDVSEVNTVLLSLLTGLGVYHMKEVS